MCFILLSIIGAWLSTHIDDLRDTSDMSLDLSVFSGTPISKLLSEPAHPGALLPKYKYRVQYTIFI